MPYALITDEVYDHPKFVGLSDAAMALWARALSWSMRHLTDGRIPFAAAQMLVGGSRAKARKACDELVTAGLFEREDDTLIFHDFLHHNPSGERVRQRRTEISKTRSEAGKRGAAARWGDGKPHGNGDGKPIANGMANAWQTDSPVPVPVPTNGDLQPKSSARSLANPNQGPILLVADVDPTATGTCPICDCPRDRAGSYVVDGRDMICTHDATPDGSASSTSPVERANDGDHPTERDRSH